MNQIRVVCSNYGAHRPRLLAVLYRNVPATDADIARWRREEYSPEERAAGFGPPTPEQEAAAQFDGWGWISEQSKTTRYVDSPESAHPGHVLHQFPDVTVGAKPDGTRVLTVASCPTCGHPAPRGLTDEMLDELATAGVAEIDLRTKRR